MGMRTIALTLAAAVSSGSAWAQATNQNQGLPQPPPMERELASRAAHVTEVTLGKNMLAFATKFMNDKDEDEAETKKLIQGLDGVYVREYEFEKDNQYSAEEIDKLRQYFETGEWTPIIRERERHGETTDVMMKVVNGATKGMFILEAEPKELTIVLILGAINPEDVGKLSHIGALSALSDVDIDAKVKVNTKDKDKGKDKGNSTKKGGTQ
jgi:hypothetical protein